VDRRKPDDTADTEKDEMRATREIKEWVLLSAGIRPYLAAEFPGALDRAVRDRYPDMGVEISFVPAGSGGGPGKPWEVTGGGDPENNRKIEVHLFALEKHLAAESARCVFGPANSHPEEPGSRVCPACSEGVVRAAEDWRGDCCDRCGTPW